MTLGKFLVLNLTFLNVYMGMGIFIAPRAVLETWHYKNINSFSALLYKNRWSSLFIVYLLSKSVLLKILNLFPSIIKSGTVISLIR